MAIMIPASIKNIDGVTPGEIFVFNLLRELLPDTFYVWYDALVKDKYPDFIVLGPDLGVIVLEVKDWEIGSIISANADKFSLRTTGREPPNPLKQVKLYMRLLVDFLKRYDQLKEKTGNYKGNLKFNYGHGVILTEIKANDFFGRGFSDSLPARFVIFKDTLHYLSKTHDRIDLKLRLQQMIPTNIKLSNLLPEDIETIKMALSGGDSYTEVNPPTPYESYNLKSILLNNNRKLKGTYFYIFLILLLMIGGILFWNSYSNNTTSQDRVIYNGLADVRLKDSKVIEKSGDYKLSKNNPAERIIPKTKDNENTVNAHTQQRAWATGAEDNKEQGTKSVHEGVWIKGNITKSGQKIYHVPNQRFYSSTIPEEWFRTEQEAINAGYRKAKDFWIKGNVGKNGEKIYHMPGQDYYDATVPEEWFKTEEEAILAGYRKSKI